MTRRSAMKSILEPFYSATSALPLGMALFTAACSSSEQPPKPAVVDQRTTEDTGSRPPVGSSSPSAEALEVEMPGGTYQVGSGKPLEAPVHQVTLAPYFLDRDPVSRARFETFMRQVPGRWEAFTGRLAESEREGRGDYPASSVTWDEASAFCQAQKGRLPTEEELEVAIRGEDGRPYPWGKEWNESLFTPQGRGPHPIGKYADTLSPQGVVELVGNVFHWTHTPVRLMGAGAPERNEPELKVIKAGGWPCVPRFNQAGFRTAMNRGFHSPYVGFRCARAATPDKDPNIAAGGPQEPFTRETFDATEGLRQLFSYEMLPGRHLEPDLEAHVKQLPPGSVVADVGSGIGFLSFALSEAVGAAGQVYAVDIDPTVLEFVDECPQLSSQANVKTLVSKPADAMLPAETFDEVFLLGTVHCLNEDTWKPFFESCLKALKKGGLLVVQDNTTYPIVPRAMEGLPPLGVELVTLVGTQLPSEQGASPAGAPSGPADTSAQAASGHLYRVYRKN